MRLVGFSTGALALADFRAALESLRHLPVRAVELSALRHSEAGVLLEAIPALDLCQFSYVSFHAPSAYLPREEEQLADCLDPILKRGWPIILHPDAIVDFKVWRRFGRLLCIENMDKRKRTGRTAVELDTIFDRLPDASLCLDIAHARQVDPTMDEAVAILKRFAKSLVQIHLSEVGSSSTHHPLSDQAIAACREIAHFVPEETPVILESPVERGQVLAEIERAQQALQTSRAPVALGRTR